MCIVLWQWPQLAGSSGTTWNPRMMHRYRGLCGVLWPSALIYQREEQSKSQWKVWICSWFLGQRPAPFHLFQYHGLSTYPKGLKGLVAGAPLGGKDVRVTWIVHVLRLCFIFFPQNTRLGLPGTYGITSWDSFCLQPGKNERTLMNMGLCNNYLLGGYVLACFIYKSSASNMRLGTNKKCLLINE